MWNIGETDIIICFSILFPSVHVEPYFGSETPSSNDLSFPNSLCHKRLFWPLFCHKTPWVTPPSLSRGPRATKVRIGLRFRWHILHLLHLGVLQFQALTLLAWWCVRNIDEILKKKRWMKWKVVFNYPNITSNVHCIPHMRIYTVNYIYSIQ